MYLAKDRFGRVGRQKPGVGYEAEVESPAQGVRRGNVYLSEGQIEDDQNYYQAKANQMRALAEAERVAAIAKRKAEIIEATKRAREVLSFQKIAEADPMNDKLRRHFGITMGRTQSEQVANSVSSDVVQTNADFSSQGGRPEVVLSKDDKRPIMWRSDFRTLRIVGNPLTRDGSYGPAVTDYDRYVHGVDVNQTDVVQIAGGTILGRYNGENLTEDWASALKDKSYQEKLAAYAKMKEMQSQPWYEGPRGHSMSGIPQNKYQSQPMNGQMGTMGASGDLRSLSNRQGVHGTMGFDWSWGGITDWAGGIIDKSVDKLEDQLPEQLAKELQNVIAQGGSTQVSPSTGTVTVYHPTPSPVTTIQQATGIPSWALYTGLGLMGVGVVFMMIKAVKS